MDEDFTFKLWADFEFFLMSLWHLRKAAELMRKVAAVKSQVRTALKEFNSAVPNLTIMRDVIEHIDDYSTDRPTRRHGAISRRQLEVWASNGHTFHWLGTELDLDAMLRAGQRLYLALHGIKAASEEPSQELAPETTMEMTAKGFTEDQLLV